MISQEYLNSIFEYRNGELFYKVNHFRKNAGKKVGTKKPDGCLHVSIKGKSYLLHRVIFMMKHGYLPEQIDHIDGNRSNNQIENLRPATHSQNSQNAKTRVDSLNGNKNITYNKKHNKWRVRVQANNKRLYIGSFGDFELAELVAVEARNKYHGQFARNYNLMSAQQAKAYVATLP